MNQGANKTLQVLGALGKQMRLIPAEMTLFSHILYFVIAD